MYFNIFKDKRIYILASHENRTANSKYVSRRSDRSSRIRMMLIRTICMLIIKFIICKNTSSSFHLPSL
ncbi:hypothetical protein DXA34_01520 [[Clostridium] symbiosum]|uniref:Uncharacterized protein n=1 Tax=[Clostridium] symbiosum ATCC 14940 TaxID=411472 RepID=A0ABC9TT10_CLOSY|nr:hypothetical protein CLOSYM_03994 [[Clostridium] symbiosum ATCC 14940]RGY63540.1 hypothetical protein DXA34_01520 [[Clostridium] symbiosum]RHB59562.1 hypothetical protein DW877_16995 [[Clostridium] symbiosum]